MMEQPQRAPVVDAELARKMETAGAKPVAVVVTFHEPQAVSRLASLHLYAPVPSGHVSTAYGRLTAGAIRKLAQRHDVMRIAWTAVVPAFAKASAGKPAERGGSSMKKIDRELQQLMEKSPDGTFSVIVTFAKPVDEELVEKLGLMPASPVEALGQITAEAITALAYRADVARIRSTPPVEPQE